MAAAAAGLAACATPAAVERAELRPGLPDRAEVAGVPFEPQEELWCGPAALAMVLSWSGPKITQPELAPAVYTSGRAGSPSRTWWRPPAAMSGSRSRSPTSMV
jgi:hypothetical protein